MAIPRAPWVSLSRQRETSIGSLSTRLPDMEPRMGPGIQACVVPRSRASLPSRKQRQNHQRASRLPRPVVHTSDLGTCCVSSFSLPEILLSNACSFTQFGYLLPSLCESILSGQHQEVSECYWPTDGRQSLSIELDTRWTPRSSSVQGSCELAFSYFQRQIRPNVYRHTSPASPE